MAENTSSGVIRIALLGCGTIGRVHAQRLAQDPRARLVVLCDPDSQSAGHLRDELSIEAALETDPARAISRRDLDAVVCCSPTQAHHGQVRAALQAGLHVLCEKPLAATRREILDLLAARDRAGKIVSIAYQRRYKPPYRTARRELATGEYGRVRQIHVFVCERWHQTIVDTWRDDPAVGSGYFGDAGSHQIDICRFVTGLEIRRVLSRSSRRGSRVEIVTQAWAELDDGVELVAHYVGDAHHWREDIHFHCRHADLLLRSETVYRCRDNQIEQLVELEPASNPDADLIAAICEGQPTACPGECALPTHDWTEAVLESARTGKWVELPEVR